MHRRKQWIAAMVTAIGAATVAACGSGASTTAASTSPALTSSTSTPAASSAAGSATSPATTAPSTAVSSSAGPESNPAGDIPDSQVYVPYQSESTLGRFTVSVPEGWARSGAADAVTFTDKLNSILIEVRAAPTQPTVDTVTAIDLPLIQQSQPNVSDPKAQSVTRTAGTVILLTYRADAPPDPVTGKVLNDDVERYAFWQSGVEVVLTLSGPHGADNVDPWRTVTDSFAWSQ